MMALAAVTSTGQGLLHDLALAVVGPIVAALLGSLVIGLFVQRVARRAQDRRADHDLRHELIDEMVRAASALYLQTQTYWRAATRRDPRPQDLAELRRRLDDQYVQSRVDGLVLENKLGVYFASADPQRKWHKTMDLLTVRYFQVLEPDGGRDRATRLRNLYLENEGEDHAGLNVAALNDAKKVLDGYRRGLREATA